MSAAWNAVHPVLAILTLGLWGFGCSRAVPPPADVDPASLLRWAASFPTVRSPQLLEIARAQAEIADWPSAAVTAAKIERAPIGDLVGSKEGHKERRKRAGDVARWMIQQIRENKDPLIPPRWRDEWNGDFPPPEPFPVRVAAFLIDGSSDKAAYEGRFQEALALARSYVRGPSETPRYAHPFCVIAKYQIISGDLEGARQTLSEALEIAKRAPRSNWPMDHPRDENLGMVATLLAYAGDFEAAERVFRMVKRKAPAAAALAVCYARIKDASNAVRMLLLVRDDNDRANACVEVIRALIEEPSRRSKWPFDSVLLGQFYEHAIATAGGAGGV